MEARLDVPISLNDSFQNAAGTVAWEFMAEEYPVSPDDPPKTGESGGALPFALLTAASGLLIIGLIAFRRRQKCQ